MRFYFAKKINALPDPWNKVIKGCEVDLPIATEKSLG